jgi:hypothetical protein
MRSACFHSLEIKKIPLNDVTLTHNDRAVPGLPHT